MTASAPRTMYLSPAWTDTHEKFDDLVLRKFQSALDGGACEWSSVRDTVRDRFGAGMANIKAKVLPELKVWAQKQRALRCSTRGSANVPPDTRGSY